MAGIPETTHWRDSARNTRFFMINARAAFPLLLFLMHMSQTTLIIAVVSMIFFGILERFGFSMPVFWRWSRVVLGGGKRHAVAWWRT